VVPDVRKSLEVGAVILATVRIVPETDRHRRERRCANELAFLFPHRAAISREDLDFHTEAAALELAAIYGQQGIAESEAGHDVRTARDRRELQVLFHLR